MLPGLDVHGVCVVLSFRWQAVTVDGDHPEGIAMDVRGVHEVVVAANRGIIPNRPACRRVMNQEKSV